MTTTHTPGPWEATPGVHPAVWLIDSVKDGVTTGVRPARVAVTNEANSALIAAAPELLAALETLLTRRYITQDDWDAARAAIAAAKGERS